MSKVINYISESYDELVNNVTWPTRSEIANSAVVVLFASLLLALVVTAMDRLFESFISFVYSFLSN